MKHHIEIGDETFHLLKEVQKNSVDQRTDVVLRNALRFYQKVQELI